MPDNGFGARANSRSFLLRSTRLTRRSRPPGAAPDGCAFAVLQWSDPARRFAWPIVTQGTSRRPLTSGDFDLESARIAPDGTWWFGEEFGPFLLHADAQGRLIESPIPTTSCFAVSRTRADAGSSGRHDGRAVVSCRCASALAEYRRSLALYPLLTQALLRGHQAATTNCSPENAPWPTTPG